MSDFLCENVCIQSIPFFQVVRCRQVLWKRCKNPDKAKAVATMVSESRLFQSPLVLLTTVTAPSWYDRLARSYIFNSTRPSQPPITVTETNPSHPSLSVPLSPILKAATVLVELAGVMTYIWILPVWVTQAKSESPMPGRIPSRHDSGGGNLNWAGPLRPD